GGFRLGGFRGYLFMDAELRSGLSIQGVGAGVELDALGLPLGQATSGNLGGDNPVAASLLHSNGAQGDTHTVNPAVDLAAWWRGAPDGDGRLHVLYDGQPGPLWIGVHSGFGPLYIDQIGIESTPDPGVALLIDGGVKVAGMTAQVDELTVVIPFNA